MPHFMFNHLSTPSEQPASGAAQVKTADTHSPTGPAVAQAADPVRAPPVDIYDTPDSFRIIVALPGVPPDHVNIDYQLPSHELIIKGEVPWQLPFDDSIPAASSSTTSTLGGTFTDDFYSEKYLKVRENWPVGGRFARRIKFPAHTTVDGSNLTADLKFGLVYIRVPKLVIDKATTN